MGLLLQGCAVLVGGTGIDAKPLREVWKADAPRHRHLAKYSRRVQLASPVDPVSRVLCNFSMCTCSGVVD